MRHLHYIIEVPPQGRPVGYSRQGLKWPVQHDGDEHYEEDYYDYNDEPDDEQ